MQFIVAVYLLNKNIAQLRCLYGLNTIELKSTLANLLTFLQGKDGQRTKLSINESISKKPANGTQRNTVDSKIEKSNNSLLQDEMCNSSANLSNLNIMLHKEEQVYDISFTPSHRKKNKPKQSETGPGLSEILAVPEAFLNKQITTSTFKNYISNQRLSKNSHASSKFIFSTETENTP